MKNRFPIWGVFALAIAIGLLSPSRAAGMAPEALTPAWLDAYPFIQTRGTQRVNVGGQMLEYVLYSIPYEKFEEFLFIYMDFLEDHTSTGPMRMWGYAIDDTTFFWSENNTALSENVRNMMARRDANVSATGYTNPDGTWQFIINFRNPNGTYDTVGFIAFDHFGMFGRARSSQNTPAGDAPIAAAPRAPAPPPRPAPQPSPAPQRQPRNSMIITTSMLGYNWIADKPLGFTLGAGNTYTSWNFGDGFEWTLGMLIPTFYFLRIAIGLGATHNNDGGWRHGFVAEGGLQLVVLDMYLFSTYRFNALSNSRGFTIGGGFVF